MRNWTEAYFLKRMFPIFDGYLLALISLSLSLSFSLLLPSTFSKKSSRAHHRYSIISGRNGREWSWGSEVPAWCQEQWVAGGSEPNALNPMGTGTCWRGTKADWALEWPQSLVSINWVHEERRQVLWDRADKGTKARARMLPEGQAPPMRVTRMRRSSKPLDPCWGALLSSWGLNSHWILSPFVLFFFL